MKARFNEAAAVKPRKTAIQSRRRTPHKTSFNEAAAVKPRKTKETIIKAMEDQKASMRPRR